MEVASAGSALQSDLCLRQRRMLARVGSAVAALDAAVGDADLSEKVSSLHILCKDCEDKGTGKLLSDWLSLLLRSMHLFFLMYQRLCR